MNIFPPSPREPKVFLPKEKTEPSVVSITLCSCPDFIYDILWPYKDWTTKSMGNVYYPLYSMKS